MREAFRIVWGVAGEMEIERGRVQLLTRVFIVAYVFVYVCIICIHSRELSTCEESHNPPAVVERSKLIIHSLFERDLEGIKSLLIPLFTESWSLSLFPFSLFLCTFDIVPRGYKIRASFFVTKKKYRISNDEQNFGIFFFSYLPFFFLIFVSLEPIIDVQLPLYELLEIRFPR